MIEYSQAIDIHSIDRLGILLVVTAPSGAGKTTLVKRLLTEFSRFAFSVSCTTRAPRPWEVNSQDYYFLTREDFDARIINGFFAEWAEVHGDRYGTPLAPLLTHIIHGRDVLLDLDIQGAIQLKARLAGCYIFILPPSIITLRERLMNRGIDTFETINHRLSNAISELREAKLFDTWVVNDDLDIAYAELKSIYIAETLRPIYRPHLLSKLLGRSNI